MKASVFVLAAMFMVGAAAPAQAQLGGLGKLKKAADKAVDTKEKVDGLSFTDEEEKQLGEQVSQKLRDRFGVVQSEPVTKYVTLVGKVIAASSTRPNIDWQFIVLDTDGVNAYAAPGGFIHVTRGLLAIMKDESQLAGVLGHEVTHVSAKHTINAINRNKRGEFAAELAGGSGGIKSLIAKAAEMVFNDLFEGKYSQGDEADSDKLGAQMANKAGYAAGGMAEVLKMIAERNAGRQDRNGFFSSHPDTQDRINKIEKQIKAEKLTGAALVAARYGQVIKFEAKPMTEVAMDVEGAAGLASGGKKKEDEKKAEDTQKEEQKKGRTFGVSAITANKEKQSGQQVASAGARGGVPDRDAVGGPNKSKLGVKITAAELEAFKKGIAS